MFANMPQCKLMMLILDGRTVEIHGHTFLLCTVFAQVRNEEEKETGRSAQTTV